VIMRSSFFYIIFLSLLLSFFYASIDFWGEAQANWDYSDMNSRWLNYSFFLLDIFCAFVLFLNCKGKQYSKIFIICILWLLIMPLILLYNKGSVGDYINTLLWPLLFEANYLFIVNKKGRIKTLVLIVFFVWLFGLYYFLFEGFSVERQTNTIFYAFIPLPFFLLFKSRNMQIVILLLFTFLVLLSMKRSAMLAMALIWIMFFFILYFKGDKRKKGGICVVTILASILSYYIFQSVDKSVGGELSERVNTEETENTGRPLIWATTWVMIHDCSPQQLILGNGHYGVKRDSFLELSAHNEYLETLYDYGIIVFVIYLYFIALLVKKCVCFYKSNSVFLIPYITSLCIFFSITMVGHLLLYTSYFNLLILFWSSIEAYIYGCKDSSHIQEHNTSNNKMLCIY
jgi:O-antigen ligase